MRVLGHIHTLNDADVIEQIMGAIARQSHPVDAILIVDNGSTDATLNRPFSDNVTVIRHANNLGTNGTVRTGFSHALKEGFDWIWIFDADSVPEPEALANLLAFYDRLPPAEQEKVCFLACPPTAADDVKQRRAIVFAGSGIEYLRPDPDAVASRCDCTFWSGSLYRLKAVEKIGLPSADYVLDVGELEYGYRARQAGFTSYIVHSGVIHHDVGRRPGFAPRVWRIGPIEFQLYDSSPIRCYYSMRNWIYFWLYQCKPRQLGRVFRSILRSLIFTTMFAVRPVTHYRHVFACLRGIRDGLTMHIERRY